jgi:hypothetical protein
MDALQGWEDAPAFLLSCPGPLHLHPSFLVPIAQHRPFQCLFGYDAQLMAYALATRAEAARTFFLPAPEIIDAPASRAALAAALGRPLPSLRRLVHLRFGPARTARVLKGARNAHAMAEDHVTPPAETSPHPFASGLVLPAAVGRVLYYEPGQVPPRTAMGAELHGALLPPAAATADIDLARRLIGRDTALTSAGLQIVGFADYTAAQFEDAVPAIGSPIPDGDLVLIPWNLQHAGSILPEILVRLARVATTLPPSLRLVLFPFNEAGRNLPAIAHLIDRVRDAAGEDAPAMLARCFVARLGAISALAALLLRFGAAWVDGNDPEHRWTLRRTAALGLPTLLIDTRPSIPLPDRCAALTERIPADEPMRLEAMTRVGRLVARVHALSWRGLAILVARTEARLLRPDLPEPAPRPRRRAPRPRARRAAAPA